ncbi:MAG TPA: type II toxin-antitoxin system RelE/ParE family toxin [Methylosinus sp.]|jgi:toxin ParE1/3/4|uniref:type II toxin-antitoxin system RelE/ParE family toxin n=1 Tax=Methylosinus sp. TaxID=427 RepID=UPI002F93A1E4
MTTRVVVTALADADMADILAEIAREAGVRIAEKYNRRFESFFERIAAHPEICPSRASLGAHVRIGVVFPYLVYRRLEGEDLLSVIRILHGRRDITRDLLQ